MALFLDLIGWSEDQGLGSIYDYEHRSLGCLELSKLAAALNEYATAPQDVSAYVEQLMGAGEEEDEDES